MSDTHSGGAPRRQLGLGSATTLVIASMVGTGVFTTSGFLLADLGTRERVLLAWAVGGVMAALGALSYGALARRLPESGGEYLFLSRTLHPAAGYMAGWISFLAGFSAPLAASAIAFGEYSKGWWPGILPQAAASVLLVVAAMIHGSTVRGGMTLHNAAVVLKVLVIGVFISLALSRVEPAMAPAESVGPFPIGTFAVALIWISFSYSGWNAAVYVGGEVRDPERTLPRALLLGTALVTALYLVLNSIFLWAAPMAELAGQVDVAVIAARSAGGERLARLVSVLICLGLVAHVSAMTMAGPRVSAQMASDGCLPRLLAAGNGKPPRAALVLQTLAALTMLWLAAYDRLLTYIGFTLSLSTAAVVVSLVRLRIREGKSLRVPGWPWVPLAFLMMTLWTAAFSVALRPVESLIALGLIGLGGIAWRYLPAGRTDPRLAAARSSHADR